MKTTKRLSKALPNIYNMSLDSINSTATIYFPEGRMSNSNRRYKIYRPITKEEIVAEAAEIALS